MNRTENICQNEIAKRYVSVKLKSKIYELYIFLLLNLKIGISEELTKTELTFLEIFALVLRAKYDSQIEENLIGIIEEHLGCSFMVASFLYHINNNDIGKAIYFGDDYIEGNIQIPMDVSEKTKMELIDNIVNIFLNQKITELKKIENNIF